MSRISTFDINYVVWLKLSASCDIILHLNFNKMKIYLKIMWHYRMTIIMKLIFVIEFPINIYYFLECLSIKLSISLLSIISRLMYCLVISVK